MTHAVARTVVVRSARAAIRAWLRRAAVVGTANLGARAVGVRHAARYAHEGVAVPRRLADHCAACVRAIRVDRALVRGWRRASAQRITGGNAYEPKETRPVRTRAVGSTGAGRQGWSVVAALRSARRGVAAERRIVPATGVAQRSGAEVARFWGGVVRIDGRSQSRDANVGDHELSWHRLTAGTACTALDREGAVAFVGAFVGESAAAVLVRFRHARCRRDEAARPGWT